MIANRKALRIIGGKQTERPTFQATKDELETITRFLTFALADAKHQLDEMRAEPGVSRTDLDQAIGTAVLISNYIKALAGGIEQMAMRPMVDVTPPRSEVN